MSDNQIETFGQLYDLYMEVHGVHCKSRLNMKRCFESYLSDWKDRPVASISKLDVAKKRTELAGRISPTTANRVQELITMIFRKCAELGLPVSDPAAGIKKFRLKPRERFLEMDELRLFFQALESLRYDVTRDFILMCLFTAARRSNVAAMAWADISIERRVWFIPETKNGMSQYLTLTDEAMAVLQRRRNESKGDCPWVFPSHRSESGHLTKPEEAFRVVIERAGLQNVRLHDLRRTLASWLAINGENLSVIALMLNHKDIKSTQIYARLNTAALAAAMQRATSRITN